MHASQNPKKHLFMVRRVAGRSMSPVLDPGRIVIAVRAWRYREEDVVILWHNGTEKIKRIWLIRGDRYDVRGDNPSRSTDSRQFGLVKRDALLARVIWPRI